MWGRPEASRAHHSLAQRTAHSYVLCPPAASRQPPAAHPAPALSREGR